ncbi:MAG: hypothetical protein ACXV2E_01595 [Halobacteriota archaeon]
MTKAQVGHIAEAIPPVVMFEQSGHGLIIEEEGKFNRELDWR